MSREFPLDLLRPDAPTAPAFSVAQRPRRTRLDQNESPGDLPAEVKRTTADALVEAPWNRYPQPRQYREAKSRFAAAVGQSPERGIRIRDVSSLPGLGEHLRVTIGSREENDLFLAALAEARSDCRPENLADTGERFHERMHPKAAEVIHGMSEPEMLKTGAAGRQVLSVL